MTRINCGIPTEELTDKHLMAEHREIKRIPNDVKKYHERGTLSLEDQPEEFKLGKGHVKFFYDKLYYLKKRYEKIYAECIARGFNMTYFGDAWSGIPPEYMGDYEPTERDREIIRERIAERLSGKKD